MEQEQIQQQSKKELDEIYSNKISKKQFFKRRTAFFVYVGFFGFMSNVGGVKHMKMAIC